MCKLIAIEGLNGAGKTVLCAQIANKLQKQGYRVLIIKAPIYEIQEDQIDHFGPNIYNFLNNGESFDLEKVDLMFKVNRQYIQDNIIMKNIDLYDYILIDRWSMSGIVYGYFRREQPRLRSISDEIPMFNVNQIEKQITYKYPLDNLNTATSLFNKKEPVYSVQRRLFDSQIDTLFNLKQLALQTPINTETNSKSNKTKQPTADQSFCQKKQENSQLQLTKESLNKQELEAESSYFTAHYDQQDVVKEQINKQYQQTLTNVYSLQAEQLQINRNMSPLFAGIGDSFVQYLPLNIQGEIVPDLTIFLDTEINEIVYRIQARQSYYLDKQTTNKQIYSSIDALSQIRHIFRCYINQHIHRQNILVIQNSDQIKDIICKIECKQQPLSL